jgi:hypothetical protein
MLEAVRLMEIGDDSTKIETKPDSQKSALVMYVLFPSPQ